MAVQTERVAALSGLGGVGKTQTARAYAYRFRSEYRTVLWAAAESREALTSGYAELARVLNLPEKDAKDEQQAVVAVKRWMAREDGWLLILDNADDIRLAAEFFPRGETGHVLLTTRASAMGTYGHLLELKEMEPEEGALFLLRRAKIIKRNQKLDAATKECRKQAIAVSIEMGGLPLALDQAAAYIEENSLIPAEYLELYRCEGARLRAEQGLGSEHQTVAVTFSLAFQKVEAETQDAADLIRFCAFLAHDRIPEEILTAFTKPGCATACFSSNTYMAQARSVALRYSLLSRNATDRTLNIHPLVQAVVRDTLSAEEQMAWKVSVVHALNEATPHVRCETWPACERLLQHILQISNIDSINTCGIELSRILHQAAYYLGERARFVEAYELNSKAIELTEGILGANHPDLIRAITNQADTCRELGLWKEAECFYQQALEGWTANAGQRSLEAASAMTNLAGLYQDLRIFGEAEPLHELALSIRQETLHDNDPDIANSLHNLAGIYLETDRIEKAEDFLERAKRIYEENPAIEQIPLGITIHSLAATYYRQGRYADAERTVLEAMEILRSTVGDDHPTFASAVNTLGAILHEKGDLDGAEIQFWRALRIKETVFGNDHHELSSTLYNLATLLMERGNQQQARELCQRALSLLEKTFGIEYRYSRMVRQTLQRLGE